MRIQLILSFFKSWLNNFYRKQLGGNGLQPGGGPNPGQPSWMSHPAGAPQSFEQNVQAARNAAGQVQGQQQQLPSNVIQPSPSLSQAQSQNNHNGFVSPRPGPTPQQGQPGSQHPPGSFNIPTNAMGTPFPFPTNATLSTGSGPSPLIQPNRPQGGNLVNNFGKGLNHPIHPLDKKRFEFTYKNFCQRKGLKLDESLLTVDNQPIDLHGLHVQVLQEGGLKNVSPIIFFSTKSDLTDRYDRLRRKTYGISLAHAWALFSSIGLRTNLQNLGQELLKNWHTSTRNISSSLMASI